MFRPSWMTVEQRHSIEIVLAALAFAFDNKMLFIIIASIEVVAFFTLISDQPRWRQIISAVAIIALFFLAIWQSVQRD